MFESALKRNKVFIFMFFLILLLIGYSYYQYYQDHFSYAKGYYDIKEFCYEGKDLEHEYCSRFRTREQIEDYINSADPKVAYKNTDAISVTCSIIRHYAFSHLQFLSPLVLIIAVIGTIHSELSSGMFKNYLLRMDYKKYLKRMFKVSIKASLLMPISLITIFLIACVMTQFNFQVVEEIKTTVIYNEWKYANFLLYGSIICLTQFFISIFFSNIALLCCRKNKNKLVAIILSYLTFLVVYLFIYLVIYVLIINKLLGFKNLTDFFSITGYWFFDKASSSFIALIASIVFQFISTFTIYCLYRNKERMIIENEKQMA